ncbi:hypothetical protein [Paenibacillus sp. M2]|uniref:hypothetical protein n=1 Tax=Paenibacillus sp. M2 TaxID=3341793 RepID=UPI00398A1D84
MFKVEDIAKKEHNLVLDARQEYGEVYKVAVDYLELSWELFSKIKPEAQIFAITLGQAKSSNYLALLSILRHHLIQAKLNMRVSYESTIIACYSLVNNEIEKILSEGYPSIDQFRKDEKDFKKDAYTWIENNYKSHSDRIKNSKNNINKGFAHSAFSTSVLNHLSKETSASTSFFDVSIHSTKEGHLDVITNLLHFSFSINSQLDFVTDVLKDYPLVTIIDDYEDRKELLFEKLMTLSVEPEYL